MKILTRLYSLYIIAVFISLFVVFLVPFLIIAQRNSWHFLALKINYYWAKLFFKLSFIPYQIIYHTKPKKDQRYILCGNHFSYIDIPAMGLIPLSFKFYGKSSLATIPVFGYMYRKIHITVNRASLRSKKDSFEKAKEALDYGFNLAMFPEGGIIAKSPPTMEPFKDGAFQLAVQKQVAILPITFINNHQILPDDNRYLFHRGVCKIVVHDPVFPNGTTNKEVDELKHRVYEIIQTELNNANNLHAGR